MHYWWSDTYHQRRLCLSVQRCNFLSKIKTHKSNVGLAAAFLAFLTEHFIYLCACCYVSLWLSSVFLAMFLLLHSCRYIFYIFKMYFTKLMLVGFFCPVLSISSSLLLIFMNIFVPSTNSVAVIFMWAILYIV